MKKIILSAIVLAVVVIAAYAFYGFGLRKTETEDINSILAQNDCYVCHSANPKLPFYSVFPIIGPMMDEHVQHAQKFIDLEKATSDMNKINEVTLSMIEYALNENTMPIKEYKMIHWGTTFNDKEKDVLQSWIRKEREAKYGSQNFVNEPVCVVPISVIVDSLKAKLGYDMYYDTRISKDGSIACATCHQLEKGGADARGTRTSQGINGQFGGVNAPTVYNAFFNVQQFWNGRAADLQQQAAGPPTNPVEMGDQTLEEIAARLNADKDLAKRFQQIYPQEGLTPNSLTDAIAQFEMTLLTPDSKFDKYLKGDSKILSDEEELGYEQFKSNGCACCHTGVILGGKSFERLGIFYDYFADRDSSIVYNADDDGLKSFTGKDEDYQKFKVPGLRNIALTAPYFHDGSVTTIEDAVDKMAHYELNKKLDETQISEITTFLKSLTGENKYLN